MVRELGLGGLLAHRLVHQGISLVERDLNQPAFLAGNAVVLPDAWPRAYRADPELGESRG